jgi:hypothetical protein
VARLFAATLLLLVGFAAEAVAAPHDQDFAGAVPGAGGKTWIDLLSQVFPDIAATDDGNAEATQLIDLRSIGAGDDSWVQCGDKIRFQDRDARAIHLDGRDYLIVTVDIEDDCVGLIALFDAAGKLIDAVNVKGDQHVSFSGDYARPLGPGGALVLASLWHDNSAQSYDITSLILARPNGLSSIGDVLALGSHDCGGKANSMFTEEATVRVVPDGNPLARIEVAVSREMNKLADDCETKLGREIKTTFNGYWRWSAGKGVYEPHIDELKKLDDWNEKRT